MKKRQIIGYALALILISACTEEEVILTHIKEPISFSTSISVESVFPNDASHVTRGIQETVLATGQIFYVWAQKNGSADYDYLKAWALASESGNLTGALKYYPEDGSELNFVAIHGRTAYTEDTDLPESIKHNVYLDQSTDVNYHLSDLIYGSGTGSITTNTGVPVDLGLVHKLSKIEINLNAGTGYTNDALAADNVSVSFDKIKCAITINPKTGALGEASEYGTVKAHKSGSSFEMIIPPQDAPAFITVRIGSETCAVPTNVTSFESNKRYVYDITITSDDVGVSISSINNTDTQYKGYFIGRNGKAYKTRDLCRICSGNDAVAVIAYVGTVSRYFDKFIAIALEKAQDHVFGWTWTAGASSEPYKWAQNHAVNVNGTNYNTIPTGAYDYVTNNRNASTATRTAAVVKGWRVPSVTDWRYVFAGASNNQLSVSSPIGIGKGLPNSFENEQQIIKQSLTALSGGNYSWWSGAHTWSSSEAGSAGSSSAWYYFPSSSGTWDYGDKSGCNPMIYLVFAY